MKDPEDDPLETEFKKACEQATEPDQWSFFPSGETTFEKGLRRGINLVLLTIRDDHGPIDLYPQDDGSYQVSMSLYENLSFQQDFTKTIEQAINWVRGNDDDVRRLSAYLRAQADEVDKAIGWTYPRRRQEALEEEP